MEFFHDNEKNSPMINPSILDVPDKRLHQLLNKMQINDVESLLKVNPYLAYREQGIGRHRIWLLVQMQESHRAKASNQKIDDLVARFWENIFLLFERELDVKIHKFKHLKSNSDKCAVVLDSCELMVGALVRRKNFDLQEIILRSYYHLQAKISHSQEANSKHALDQLAHAIEADFSPQKIKDFLSKFLRL